MGINYKTSLVLLAQSPYTIFCYFNIEPSIVKGFEEKYGFNSWDLSKPIIKVYSIAEGEAKEIKTIFIDLKADSWYINLEKDNLTLFLKLGRLLPDDSFVPIRVSNIVTTARSNQVRQDESIEECEFFKKFGEEVKKLGTVSSNVK
jgi:hypothetical protein